MWGSVRIWIATAILLCGSGMALSQTYRATSDAVPHSLSGWGGYSGTGGPMCPPGSYVGAIQGFKSDNQGTHEEPKGLHDFISELRYTCYDTNGNRVAVGGTHPIPTDGKWGGFSGTDTTICPGGSFVTAIQAFKSEAKPYISELRYICKHINGTVVQVGGTSKSVPPRNGWDGFSTTDYYDFCPDGSFVVAVQGFKSDAQGNHKEPGGWHHYISELRYTCMP